MGRSMDDSLSVLLVVVVATFTGAYVARWWLVEVLDDQRKALLETARKHPDHDRRREAYQRLYDQRPAETIQVLVEYAASDPAFLVRERAARLLGQSLRQPSRGSLTSVHCALTRLSQDESWGVRKEACVALDALATQPVEDDLRQKVLEHLRRLADDAREEVRSVAQHALNSHCRLDNTPQNTIKTKKPPRAAVNWAAKR